MKLITLTSDFGVQSQGVGIMEGVVADLAPDARVIHLMHGLPDFDIAYAARTMETLLFVPRGIHVCVVDPGVGTSRKGIIIETKRGDFLVGPDNGVLIPGARMLGGVVKAVELSNPEYMREEVSPLFHGRDVFSPAAAHLANGVKLEQFGKEILGEDLVKAPYGEASVKGDIIEAEVISINKFGSAHLNILHEQWDAYRPGKEVTIEFSGKKMTVPVVNTFGDVPTGNPCIMKDDYARVEIAINQGRFCDEHGLKIGDKVLVRK